MVTIQKIGDSPNVQYKEYICDSVEDLAAIQAPVAGSTAYIYENGKVNKYMYTDGAWVQQKAPSSITPTPVEIHPDWNENDSTSKNYIANRTHWKENGLSYEMPQDKSGLDRVTVDVGEFQLDYYKIGYPIEQSALNDCTFTLSINDVESQYAISDFTVDTETNFTALIASNPFSLPVLIITYEPNTYFEYDGVGATVENPGCYAISVDLSDIERGSIELATIESPSVFHKLSMDYLPDSAIDAIDKKHTHSNKAVLDDITSQTLTDVASNTSIRHTHTNKAVLDDVGSTTIIDAIKVTTLEQHPINDVHPYTPSQGNYTGAVYAGVPLLFNETLTNENAIVITALTNNAGFYYPEYIIEFTTGSTVYEGESGQTYTPPAPALVLPDSVQWVDELTIEANKHYQISIVNNIALWCAVDVEAEEVEE